MITLVGRDIYYSHFTNEDTETLEKKIKKLTEKIKELKEGEPCI